MAKLEGNVWEEEKRQESIMRVCLGEGDEMVEGNAKGTMV